jgi:hypothetical protein
MARHKISESERRSLSELTGNVVLYATFALLMFGPLAFGAVEPWSTFVLEIGAVSLTAIWFGKQWLDGQLKIRWNPLFLPMAAFGVLVLIQIVFRITAYRHATSSAVLL